MKMIKYHEANNYGYYVGLENDELYYNIIPLEETRKIIINIGGYKDLSYIARIKGVYPTHPTVEKILEILLDGAE